MNTLNRETQVIIYLDDLRGQVMQTSYAEYLSYWRHIGRHLEGPAPELPGMKAQRVLSGLQGGLI